MGTKSELCKEHCLRHGELAVCQRTDTGIICSCTDVLRSVTLEAGFLAGGGTIGDQVDRSGRPPPGPVSFVFLLLF